MRTFAGDCEPILKPVRRRSESNVPLTVSSAFLPLTSPSTAPLRRPYRTPGAEKIYGSRVICNSSIIRPRSRIRGRKSKKGRSAEPMGRATPRRTVVLGNPGRPRHRFRTPRAADERHRRRIERRRGPTSRQGERIGGRRHTGATEKTHRPAGGDHGHRRRRAAVRRTPVPAPSACEPRRDPAAREEPT